MAANKKLHYIGRQPHEESAQKAGAGSLEWDFRFGDVGVVL